MNGAAWYQGESDVGVPGYADRLRELFAGWRRQFSPDMRMLVVQLPNYEAPVAEKPVAAGWAELREEQRRAVAADANAALIPTLDLGQHDNLHLAGQAAGWACGSAAAAQGTAMPMPRSATRESGSIRLAFSGIEGGLQRWSGAPLGVELCGRDAGQLPLRAGERLGRQLADRRRRQAGDAGPLRLGGKPGGQPLRRARDRRARRSRSPIAAVKLAAGAWQATLRPEVGGALA